MPELPEVETIKRGLQHEILNQCIISTDVRNPNLRWPVQNDLTERLNNQKILDVSRKGKVICIKLTEGYILLHLGMTGKILIKSPESTPQKHDHIIIKLKNKHLFYNDIRRFGYIEWTNKIDKANIQFNSKGLDPFDKNFTYDYLTSKLRKSKVKIKVNLMNEKILMGIGNIYANALLFRAGIHPCEQSNLLTDLKMRKIFENIIPLLNEATDMGGSTLRDYVNLNGIKGTFQNYHKVYNRSGLPCKSCGKNIEKIIISNRSNFYCPFCQTF